MKKMRSVIKSDKGAHVRNDRIISGLLKQHQPVLIFVYADWCGYCQSFRPTFDEYAKTAKFPILEMDIGAMKELAVRNQAIRDIAASVTTVPHLAVRLPDGRIKKYEGDRTVEKIRAFMEKYSAKRTATASAKHTATPATRGGTSGSHTSCGCARKTAAIKRRT